MTAAGGTRIRTLAIGARYASPVGVSAPSDPAFRRPAGAGCNARETFIKASSNNAAKKYCSTGTVTDTGTAVLAGKRSPAALQARLNHSR